MAFLILGYMAGRYTKSDYKIKYDLRGRKIYAGVAVISTILAAGLISLSRFSIMDVISVELGTFIMFGGFLFFPVIGLTAGLGVVSSTLYLRRLKKHGYEIPMNKYLYSSSLHNLNKTEFSSASGDGCSKESVVLATMSFVIFLGVIVNAVVFYHQYRTLALEDIGLYGSIPLLLFWQIMTCFF